MPKISVIVPVYNADHYLHRCIDSICAQTFTDFELLLIDDGSTDLSGIICDEYAAKDPRIRVFHIENCGVSSARNYGLEKAIGIYIVFIDSDDWVDQQYLQLLYPKVDEDMIVCSLHYEGTNGGEYKLSDTVYPTKDCIKKNLDNLLKAFPITTCWAKILKRSIIEFHNIRFDTSINAGEDMLFIYKYIGTSLTSIRTISVSLYHYTVDNDSSLSHKVVPFNMSLSVMDCIHECLLRISDRYSWNMDDIYKHLITVQLANIYTYIKHMKNIRKRIIVVCQMIKNEHIRTLIKDKQFIKDRLANIVKRRIDRFN